MPKKTIKRTKGRKVSRKGKGVSRKGKRVSRKASKGRKSAPKRVKEILSSTYGIAGLMDVDEKGYKAQRVAKKDPYKNKKAKHPPIPSNIKGKKKKKSSSKAAKDSFLAGIDSKPSKKVSWIEHVKSYWEERRKTEPGYKYKDAMKDAKKTW